MRCWLIDGILRCLPGRAQEFCFAFKRLIRQEGVEGLMLAAHFQSSPSFTGGILAGTVARRASEAAALSSRTVTTFENT